MFVALRWLSPESAEFFDCWCCSSNSFLSEEAKEEEEVISPGNISLLLLFRIGFWETDLIEDFDLTDVPWLRLSDSLKKIKFFFERFLFVLLLLLLLLLLYSLKSNGLEQGDVKLAESRLELTIEVLVKSLDL